tara:strand:- start:279 stop:1469 length:1191 start_codon:yes stop_codon:yes gene_type:complete
MEKHKANKAMRLIREELRISKSKIAGDFINAGVYFLKENKKTKTNEKISKISNRTYASIEEGKNSFNSKYFKWISQLFSHKYKNNKTNTQVDVSDIVESQSINDPKSYSTFLYRIKNINDLSDIINNSFKYSDEGQERLGDITNYRKTFFNCFIKKENQAHVEKLLNIAETFTNNIDRFEILNLAENKDGEDEYSFKDDIKFLKVAADGNDAIEQLSKLFGISLFVGLLKNIPVVDFDIENIDENVSTELERHGDYKVYPVASTRNYLIYNFTNTVSDFSDTAETVYQSELSYKEIKQILGKEKLSINYTGNREKIENMDSHTKDLKTNLFAKKIKLPFSLNKKNFIFSNMNDADQEYNFEDYNEFKQAAKEDYENDLENQYYDSQYDAMKEMQEE